MARASRTYPCECPKGCSGLPGSSEGPHGAPNATSCRQGTGCTGCGAGRELGLRREVTKNSATCFSWIQVSCRGSLVFYAGEVYEASLCSPTCQGSRASRLPITRGHTTNSPAPPSSAQALRDWLSLHLTLFPCRPPCCTYAGFGSSQPALGMTLPGPSSPPSWHLESALPPNHRLAVFALPRAGHGGPV
ncbi:hypothetical protein P7K49_036428 [Saguinus oedipus]|uniref:Uncharacterized protein n=1 Tax=Saguinus oedipus TaxID=9490 RepID=A0ABQ9TK26_SAGOE|nr:hypothetical protein P7K49_036428 [Saguinus oedipus]